VLDTYVLTMIERAGYFPTKCDLCERGAPGIVVIISLSLRRGINTKCTR
jgi:hypothetical protein